LADVGPLAFVDQCQEEHRHVLGGVVGDDPIPTGLALASEPDLSGATRAGDDVPDERIGGDGRGNLGVVQNRRLGVC
jgi:hypothetical protein